MFGISGGEFIVLAIVAMLVLGPDKLPQYVAQLARFLRTVRRLSADAREQVSRELGPEFRDISLEDLNPRRFVTKHLLDGEDFDLRLGLDLDEATEPRPPAPKRSRVDMSKAKGGLAPPSPGTRGATSLSKAGSPSRDGAPPPYDADAT